MSNVLDFGPITIGLLSVIMPGQPRINRGSTKGSKHEKAGKRFRVFLISCLRGEVFLRLSCDRYCYIIIEVYQ